MNKTDLLTLFSLSFLAALSGVCARIGYQLFRIDVNEPIEEKARQNWRRKRRWLAISEISALPFFAFLAVASKIWFDLGDISAILIAMVCGALGFGFLLDGLQFLVRKRLELPND